MKLNEEIYSLLVPILETKGLTNSKYTDHNGGLDFFKNDGENDHRVTLDLVVEKIGFGNIYARISFSSVIDILGKVEELRSNMYEGVLVNYDLLGKREYWLGIFKDLSNYSLKSKSGVEEFKQRVVKHIDIDVLPFFEKFPNVESVNELILSKMNFEEFPNYISGNCTLKSMIIMKMFGNPRLKEYREVKDKEYQFYVNQNPIMWQPAYDSFLRTSKYLGVT